jgi:hypothetical protein
MEEWKNGRVEGWKSQFLIRVFLAVVDLEGCGPPQPLLRDRFGPKASMRSLYSYSVLLFSN